MQRQRGVMLRLLDVADLEVSGLECLQRLEGDEWNECSIGSVPYAAKEIRGTLYVVCHEGVGWEVADDKPLMVPLYGAKRHEHGRTMRVVPFAEAMLRPDEVRERMRDEIDLADLIRTFGSRLESNFVTWAHLLTEEVARDDVAGD